MKKIFFISMIALFAGIVAFFVTLVNTSSDYEKSDTKIIPVRVDKAREYVQNESSIMINPNSLTNNNINEKNEVKEVIAPIDNTQKYAKPLQGEVVEAFSNDDLTYSETLKEWRIHNGIDIKSVSSIDVYAVNDGEIVDIKFEYELGNVIEIKHGELNAIYAAINPEQTLKVGDKVKKGEKIATISSECGFEIDKGDHLHFEIWKNGKQLNPCDVIENL